MALSVTISHIGSLGDVRYSRGTLDFDSSYPTGGESLTAADVGLSQLDMIHVHHTAGVSFEYDYTNALLLAYVQGVAVGAEGALSINDFVPTNTLASGGAIAIGLSVNSANTTAIMGEMVQVANTANMATFTGIRWFAIGV